MKCRVATSTQVAGQLQSTWDPTFPVSQTNQYDNHKNPDNVKKPRLSVVGGHNASFLNEGSRMCLSLLCWVPRPKHHKQETWKTERGHFARPRRLQRPNAQGQTRAKQDQAQAVGCRRRMDNWTISSTWCMHGCDSSPFSRF